MQPNEKSDFLKKLASVMAGYGKPMPEKFYSDSWWEQLLEFPAQIVDKAFSVYADENPTFAPHPNAVRHICKKLISQSGEQRPGVEEAWAIALTSRDEAETVVWTPEIAEAFAICSPVLEIGDEVGARMAFKEAYARIVAKAERDAAPLQWSVSIGWDLRRREATLNKAASTGLLPALVIANLLPLPEKNGNTDRPRIGFTVDLDAGTGEKCDDEKARDQLQKIKKMLADMQHEKIHAAEKAAHEEREKTEKEKKRITEQVANRMLSECLSRAEIVEEKK